MRPMVLALAGALLLALFVALPGASAQVPMPYGFAPTAPFYVPQTGIDPFGRPYALQVAGAYGPFDGLGYPVVVNTVGFYGGVPLARRSGTCRWPSRSLRSRPTERRSQSHCSHSGARGLERAGLGPSGVLCSTGGMAVRSTRAGGARIVRYRDSGSRSVARDFESTLRLVGHPYAAFTPRNLACNPAAP
jgi:hypothetical protein